MSAKRELLLTLVGETINLYEDKSTFRIMWNLPEEAKYPYDRVKLMEVLDDLIRVLPPSRHIAPGGAEERWIALDWITEITKLHKP
jgi:hypothetical protein